MRSVLYSETAIGRAFIAFHIPILIWLVKDLNRSRDWASYNNDNKVENCCEMDTVRLFSKWTCVGLNLHRLLSAEGTYGEGFSLSAGVWYNVGVSAIVCVVYMSGFLASRRPIGILNFCVWTVSPLFHCDFLSLSPLCISLPDAIPGHSFFCFVLFFFPLQLSQVKFSVSSYAAACSNMYFARTQLFCESLDLPSISLTPVTLFFFKFLFEITQ